MYMHLRPHYYSDLIFTSAAAIVEPDALEMEAFIRAKKPERDILVSRLLREAQAAADSAKASLANVTALAVVVNIPEAWRYAEEAERANEIADRNAYQASNYASWIGLRQTGRTFGTMEGYPDPNAPTESSDRLHFNDLIQAKNLAKDAAMQAKVAFDRVSQELLLWM